MSEIKPVYRYKVLETLSWLYSETEPKRPLAVVETLYPAAAYEALQKENAEMKRHHKFACENLANTVPFINQLEQENEALRKQSDEMLSAMRRAVLALAFAAESSKAMQDDYKALSNAIDRAVESKNGDSK